MAKVLYFLVTFFEGFLAIFGIRAPFEKPGYRVEETIGHDIEVRDYGPRVAVQTAADGGGFQRLFHYIAGANKRDETIAMTTPVEQRGGGIAPQVEGAGREPLMRFFLPAAIAENPPPPDDGRVSIVDLPARTVAAVRFSGSLDRVQTERYATILKQELAERDLKTEGEPYLLGYDPPFTIPFLRRNEVAIDLAPK